MCERIVRWIRRFGCLGLDQQQDGSDQAEAESLSRMDKLLRADLLTLRGRRKHLKNLQVDVTPTQLDGDPDLDDSDSGSLDEDDDQVSVFRHGVFAGQHFDSIKSRCLQQGILFVDPIFPPSLTSLYLDDRDGQIEWRRASQLCDDPQFVVSGATRFDINQGELGDCWLLAALANITLHKQLFQYVVPHDQSFSHDYAGVFHFRFWQYGEWIDVVVDDFLPVRNGRLVYMKSDDHNEFWSALLEKAYAKIFGSYEALKGGSTCEAMVDFSGGCGEHFDLKTASEDDDVFGVMLRAFERGSLMACSLEPDRLVSEARTEAGLVRGHAYSITKVAVVPVTIRTKRGLLPLVRVRNPWGNEVEWRGAWSDSSPEWILIPEDEKQKLGLTFDADGEFYMVKNDFFKDFDTLEMCCMPLDHLTDESGVNQQRWHHLPFHGQWIKDRTAGGCRNFLDTFGLNPQYKVVLDDWDVEESGHLLGDCLISLMQKGSRRKKDSGQKQGCISIGFSVYHLQNPESEPLPLTRDFFRYHSSCGKSKSFVNMREVSARFRLRAGTYIIIPSTFDPGLEADFLLRIFSERPIGPSSTIVT